MSSVESKKVNWPEYFSMYRDALNRWIARTERANETSASFRCTIHEQNFLPFFVRDLRTCLLASTNSESFDFIHIDHMPCSDPRRILEMRNIHVHMYGSEKQGRANKVMCMGFGRFFDLRRRKASIVSSQAAFECHFDILYGILYQTKFQFSFF